MNNTNATENNVLRKQLWILVEDDKDGDRTIRSGTGFAELLESLGCYRNAADVLLQSKVGDCINTCVTGYKRIE